jgi:hypothetical protein
MKKTFVFALAVAGLVSGAHAADIDWSSKAPLQFKDPLPDSLTFWGITFYATLDLGYAYQTNGRPLGSVVSGLEFIPSRPPATTPDSRSPRSPTAAWSNRRSA